MHSALSATTYFSGKNDVRDSTYKRIGRRPCKGRLCADHIASRTRKLAFEACHAAVSEDVRSQINKMVHLMHEMNHRTPSRSRTSAKKVLSQETPSRLI